VTHVNEFDTCGMEDDSLFPYRRQSCVVAGDFDRDFTFV
jgi:hypothetical protein